MTVYGKAREEYLKLRERYLNNKLHPNHLQLLRAGKRYFKDNSYVISDPEGEYTSKNKTEK